MTDYKDTLNLPKTAFPMKANLTEREPHLLKKWHEKNLYHHLRNTRKNAPTFILHDGPPYANGPIHLGTALNKILKDIIIKSKTLSGFNAPYVPGWDCHGLPIELNVEKKKGKVGDKLNPREFRQACREYAKTQVERQKEEFIRLGVFADWENPYLTLDQTFEANAVRALSAIIANGHLQRGQKPVHWCTACGSALAEAEVEYKDKTSPAIDVAFEAMNSNAVFTVFNATPESNAKIFFPIWTTTPWTLPANEAISVHPELIYVLLKTDDGYFVVADALHDTFIQRVGLENVQVIAGVKGFALENIICQHPFLDRAVPIVLGEHVTTDAGTGLVHTAPAHGQDDYKVGLEYKLPLQNPVNAKSCFTDDTPFVAGLHVFKANEVILDELRSRHRLLHLEEITHSYPHCWRHKTPLIFRATPQWFISMDAENLRNKTLKAIKQVHWIPSWGQARITTMVVSRPDWCISRQRTWGIPITLFVHQDSGELHPDTLNIMQKAADYIEKGGIDAWYETDSREFIGDDANTYVKVTDILDVWFDSGITHACVLDKRLSVPADLYLEGSDQHRGWFQSSLLTSMAIRDAAPFKTVLTHGYVVDAQGRKMSKSIGNTIAPSEIVNKMGADILRLWVASSEHTNDVNISDEILKRIADAYRRIRNTIRFLLSNIDDFDPTKHAVDADDLVALDAWVIHKALVLQRDIMDAYDAYQFQAIYQKILNFCTIELGGFYLDIIKDRQYTSAADGLPRRSAQTAMFYLLEMMLRWFAPILSFTAEEAWEYMPSIRCESIFESTWFENCPDVEVSAIDWDWFIALRNDVNKLLEAQRNDGKIGSALEACIHLTARDGAFDKLLLMKDELRFLFIVSDVKIVNGNIAADSEKSSDNAVGIQVTVITDPKCDRCWQRRESVGHDRTHETLCDRCIDNAFGDGEKRLYV